MITRRHALKSTLATLAVGAAAGPLAFAAETPPAPAPPPTGPFRLDPLPYAADALEPHIDARTMEIHHGKHHATYVANLNKALASHPQLAAKSPEDLIRQLDQVPEAVRTAVRNNGGGHLNHSWFWQMMSPKGGGEPKGALAEAITKSFGSFDAFKQEFTKAALGQFGSGWSWLCYSPTAKGLIVRATANQDNPLSAPEQAGGIPLLGLDVWEHAYYLKYQNRRADYAAAFFNVIHWEFVASRFEKTRQS